MNRYAENRRTPDAVGVTLFPQPAHALSWTAAFFVVGILGSEMLGWLFFASDAARAVLVVAVAAPCCASLVLGSRLTIPMAVIRANAGLMWGMGAFAAIGAYGTLLGYLYGNGAYYMLADVYHWFGEMLIVAALTVVMLQRMSSRSLMILMSLACLLLGVVALLAAVAGTFGLKLAGGHLIGYLHIWRLEAGRGFPAVPLTFVTAILAKAQPQGLLKLLARLAFLVMLAVLVVTFKRAQWLVYGVLVVGFLMPSRWQWLARWVAIVLVAFVAAVIPLLPGGLGQAKDMVMEMLTYNPNYETEQALDGRAMQFESVIPHVIARPLGHGFGAQIYVYTPSKDDQAETHYVHDAYLYYAVQLGIPGLLLSLLLLAGLLLALSMRFGLDPDWDWLVHGAFTSVCALSVISLTLVCFHTPVFGFSLGMAFLAIQRVRARGRTVARPVAFPSRLALEGAP